LRFAQLYRERENIIAHAKNTIAESHPIERQKSICQMQLNTILQYFNQNNEQFNGYINLMDERYYEVEMELMDEIKDK